MSRQPVFRWQGGTTQQGKRNMRMHVYTPRIYYRMLNQYMIGRERPTILHRHKRVGKRGGSQKTKLQ